MCREPWAPLVFGPPLEAGALLFGTGLALSASAFLMLGSAPLAAAFFLVSAALFPAAIAGPLTAAAARATATAQGTSHFQLIPLIPFLWLTLGVFRRPGMSFCVRLG